MPMPTPLRAILAIKEREARLAFGPCYIIIRSDLVVAFQPTPIFCLSVLNSQRVFFKMASHPYYELYRRSSIGLALIDSLDELVHSGRIEPQLAMKVIATFDKSITEVLADKVKTRLNFKGHLDTYRFCDEVWTFLIKDVSFKLDNQNTVQADRIKIVSCNAKRPGEA